MDVTNLIESGGLIAICLIIFAESGLMVGFFLPGDTLLVTAGLLASQGHFPIVAAIAGIVIAAAAGDNAGYLIGRTMGKRLFRKKDGLIFRQEYVERAEAFYEKHGAKTMLIAHFVPIVRSFAPLVAGVAKMDRRKFIFFDIIGVAVWGVLVTAFGYWFGSRVPNIDKFILPIIGLVMVVSFAPMFWQILGNPAGRARLAAKFRRRRRTPAASEADKD